MDRKKHLVGTFRANRKRNPSDITKAKWLRGNVIAGPNEDKTVVLKWKDKRDVFILNTKHRASIISFIWKGKEVGKPEIVLAYITH